MSDFLSRLTAEDTPEAREVTYRGETGTVYFRKISAGEREKLLQGLKMSHQPGKDQGIIELDLGANEHQRQLLVLFSVCNENGGRFFKNLEAVQKLPHSSFNALAKHAEEVNSFEEEDLGKS